MRVAPARVPGTTVTHLAYVPELGEQSDAALPVEIVFGNVVLRPVCPGTEKVPDLELVPDGEPTSWCPSCAQYLSYLQGGDAGGRVERTITEVPYSREIGRLEDHVTPEE